MVTLLKPGATFVDIGANVGFMSVIAARLIGSKGTVFAFEPVPENAHLIRHNASINNFRNIETIEKAVSDMSGSEELYLARHSGGAALKKAGPPPDATGVIPVDVTTIDLFVATRPMFCPIFVKIDVEGAELAVLKGMSDTLERFKPAIVFEIDDSEALKCDEKANACKSFLQENKYRISVLNDSYPDIQWVVQHYLAVPE
jgi:FkbM family methyltransferase